MTRSWLNCRQRAPRSGFQYPRLAVRTRRALFGALALAAWAAGVPLAGAQPSEPAPGRALLIQVRDTPPTGKVSFERGADRSFTVATGGAGEREAAGAQGANDNGITLGAGNAVRQLRVREGERLRVELPSLQSLQFHVPGRSAAGTSAAAAAPTPSAASGAKGSAGSRAASASGVVYFEAVSAFVARFTLHGARVQVELVPLRVDGVTAPWIDPAGVHAGALVVQGRVGEWIALGDTQLPDNAKSLNATASPPAPASVWVRVFPDSEAADTHAAGQPAADRSTVISTGQRP